jgi:hypothetical protein
MIVFRTVQFVGMSAFHTRISDPVIGGTYMTVSWGRKLNIMCFLRSTLVVEYGHELGWHLAKVFRIER